MAEFIHRKCGKIAAMVVDLRLVVISLEDTAEGFLPGVVDIRVPGEDGSLNLLEKGAQAKTNWYCHSCKSNISIDEVYASCYGCGGHHPIEEMRSTVHTSPVKMECYAQYRATHEDELLPAQPKTKSVVECLRVLSVKL